MYIGTNELITFSSCLLVIIEIAKLMKKVRKKGLSQTEVAKELNISKQRYSNYEKGRKLDYDFLEKLSKFYNVTTDYRISIENETKTIPSIEGTDITNQFTQEEILILLNDDGLNYYSVEDDSMSPDFVAGDTVYVQENKENKI